MNRTTGSRNRSGAYWIYGIHAVRAALSNPERRVARLLFTERAAQEFAVSGSGPEMEIAAPRQIAQQLPPGAAHGGAAAEVFPLPGGVPALAGILDAAENGLLVLLDQVTDPRNVGAVLRSASVFGAAAVLAPSRGSPQESGTLAKAASGALDKTPYLRIGNLAGAISLLSGAGWKVIGLDESAPEDIETVASVHRHDPIALVFGAEGKGLRRLTRERCHLLARIAGRPGRPSLNVSAAASIGLFVFSRPGK